MASAMTYLCRMLAPPLSQFLGQLDRNTAMAQACATGRYSMKQIAQAFDLHYATVSRVLAKER